MYILGFDIGGTKCAVTTARWDGSEITLLRKDVCPTDLSIAPLAMVDRMIAMAENILDGAPDRIGISCGGPLDAEKGLIQSPPNLPGWDNVPIVSHISAHFGAPVRLENDANACAVAEWRFGAGLILDGHLYRGTRGFAGEAGHIRLEKDGPVGYGKAGSFEGFCSGGGIARLGYAMALERERRGACPAYYKDGMTAQDVTAKTIADAAHGGDETAIEVYRICGKKLGRGLAVLIDLFDPERIVIGGVFARARDLLWPAARAEIEKEALAVPAAGCEVVPAALGEQIGDYAAIAAAVCEEDA